MGFSSGARLPPDVHVRTIEGREFSAFFPQRNGARRYAWTEANFAASPRPARTARARSRQGDGPGRHPLTSAETTETTPTTAAEGESSEHQHEGHEHHDHEHAHAQPTLNPECTREIEVEIPADEVSKSFRSVLKRYQKLARIPGFRPGKVPESVLRLRFASSIREDVIEAILPQHFRETIAKQDVRPVSQP